MTSKKRLTDTMLRNHPPVEKRVEYADAHTKGLWVRINNSGSPAFFFRYTSKVDKGARRRVPIGPYPAISLDEARRTVQQWLGMLAQIRPDLPDDQLRQLDPWHAKKAQEERGAKAEEERKAARGDLKTLEDAWDRYTKLRKPELKKWSNTQNIWDTHWSRFAHRPLVEITTEEIEDYLIEVRDGTVKDGSGKPAPYAANRAHDLIKAIFSKGAKRSMRGKDNPAAFPKVYKEKARTRRPTVEEVAKVWIATEAMTKPQRAVLRFSMLTLKRRGEVALAHTSHIDPEEMLWRIPAENSKIDIEEFVPLSDLALEQLPPVDAGGPCFPGRETPMLHPDTVSKYWVKACEIAKVEDFHLHDLRTAGGSYLSATHDHAYAIISRVLGHKLRQGGAVTHRYTVIEEDDPQVRAVKRRALEAWQRALMDKVDELEGSWLSLS
jgi:integrase